MSLNLVSTVTVGAGGAASIDFTSIPQTGTDLMLVLSGRYASAASDPEFYFWFNNTTAANTYLRRRLRGTGSAVASNNYSSDSGYMSAVADSGNTGNTFGNAVLYIPNYTGSTQKSWSSDAVTENNATAAYQEISAGLWTGTAAISRITLYPFTTWAQYTVASLYTISTTGATGATVS